MVAGEPSGDLLGGGLIEALKKICGEVQVEGIAGPAMMAQGCAPWSSIDRLAVMGIPEIVRRYPELKALQRDTASRVLAMRPDVFIGIDAPEFNLDLEVMVRAAGVPTVHYVSPSVWAWREGRLRTIKRGVDLMLVLFPFEESYYAKRGQPVSFVGHPLVKELSFGPSRAGARTAMGMKPEEKLLAVLPGSRMSELKHHAEVFLHAALICIERIAGLRVAVAAIDARAETLLRDLQQRMFPSLPMLCLTGRSREIMAAADAGLIACGTATLEALLLDCPMVTAYRAHWVSYTLIRPLIRIDHFSLPNLLAGAEIVPECIQRDANPQRLADLLCELLENDGTASTQRRHFAEIRETLKTDANSRAAEAVMKLVGMKSTIGAQR
jgi:lipid-A-disaccharide synthase